jgi:cyanate lyase
MRYSGKIQNGVVVFDQSVDLPDGARVEVSLAGAAQTTIPTNPDMSRIYEILSERFESGFTDTAERHNEHQP